MDKENIEDWFDRVMGDESVLPEEIILTEDDIRSLFEPPSPAPGIIYYDSSGSIRGVSQGLNAELAEKFDHIEVSTEQADQFLSGATDVSGWLVVYEGDQPRLICSSVDTLTVMPTDQPYRVITETPPAPIEIIIMVPRDSSQGSLMLRTVNGVNVALGFDRNFDFILTKKDTPDQVIVHVSVNPKHFFDNSEIEFNLGRIIPEDIDVLTKPLWPVQYTVERFDDGSRPLPLPKGRFEEFIPFKVVEDIESSKPGLLVDVHADYVHLGLIGDGGRVYDRPLTTLLVAISRANDREIMLWSTRVRIRDLQSGIDVPLDEPLDGPVEIVSARYFVNSYWRDFRSAA